MRALECVVIRGCTCKPCQGPERAVHEAPYCNAADTVSSHGTLAPFQVGSEKTPIPSMSERYRETANSSLPSSPSAPARQTITTRV